MMDLRSAFISLRRASGLSMRELAALAHVRVQDVREVESGSAEGEELDLLAIALGLDAGALRKNGALRPHANADEEQAYVFLFSGDVGDLLPDDFGHLAKTLRSARRWISSAKGRHTLEGRLAHRPRPVLGTTPSQAAKQGYRLARSVRRALGIEQDPIRDFRELLENRLGVVVFTAKLKSESLRAAAVLDAQRASAGILLQADDRDVIQRVALAHELCHILFDPSHRRSLTLTLDTMTAETSELRECRARGFSAEFLIPVAGLRALVGEPQRMRSKEDSEALIRRVRHHFGTPREIAANHLYNHRFVWSRRSVSDGGNDPDVAHVLPAPGDVPLCLMGVGEKKYAAKPAWLAAEAYLRAVEDIAISAATDTLKALTTQYAEQPIRLGIELTKEFGRAFEAGRAEYACHLLEALPSADLEDDALVGLLANIRLPSEATGSQCGEAYRTAVEHVLASIKSNRWEPDDIDDTAKLLT